MSRRIDYDTLVCRIDGKQEVLSSYRGKVLLIVNTASQCGYTPQYHGLESLWRELAPRGLQVLGFPCDQFGHQEPDSEAEIALSCERNFGVSFPLHAKIDVNGPNAHPLFRTLAASAPGLLGSTSIKWNFTKFLIGRDGTVLERYAPRDAPESLRGDIERALAAPPPR